MRELRNRARQLKADREFQEAVEIYEKMWSRENTDKWLGWEYAYCLKQIHELTKAIAVCKHTFVLDKGFNVNNDLMAWCVYEKYFRDKKDIYSAHEVENLERTALAIISLIKQNSKSAYERIVFSLINIYKKKGDKKSYIKILEWLDRLNVDLLSTDILVYVDKNGKDSELQSRQEEYYSLRTKSLLALERYKECIAFSEEAEKTIEKFHYGNEIWIQARRYYSYGMLGDYEKAIEGMKELVNKKNHWSLLFKISIIYDHAGETDMAMRYSYKALLCKDPDKMKVKVIYFVAQKLHESGEIELADLHYCYYKQIREANNWGISTQVEAYISNIPVPEKKFSVDRLRRIWLSKVKSGSKLYYGKVSKIMPNKKNGFISFDNKSIFFRVNEAFGRNKVKENVKVSFIIEKSFDNKKNRDTQEAKYVEVL